MTERPKYDKSPVSEARRRSLELLGGHRLQGAIDVLTDTLTAVGAPRSIMSRAEALKDDCRRMTESVIRGEADPERRIVYDSLSSRLVDMWARIDRQYQAIDNPSLYFSTLRYERMHPADSFDKLSAEYDKAIGRVNELLLTAKATGTEAMLRHKPEMTAALRDSETVARRIFNRLWTGFPLSVEAEEPLMKILDNAGYADEFRCQMTSALTLGQLQYYDELRMKLLIRLYNEAGSTSVRLRALTGLLMSMWVHRNRPESRSIALLMDNLEATSTTWADDVRMAYKQLIRSRDTKRIDRKFKEEILPEMMKMTPEMLKRIKKLNLDDGQTADTDAAEQLEDLLDNSRLKDKLKELSEMQEDGSDVFLSTFAGLKNFAFFRELSNWFLPYSTLNSVFMTADFDGVDSMLKAIADAPILCDNDKYSMALALERVPAAQREMMAAQMSAHSHQAEEIASTELLPENKSRENYVNRYVQDLYRFFSLFSRHKEWSNPFDTALNLLSIDRLTPILGDVDTMIVTGEFYFKRGYYADARDVFERLAEKMPPTETLFQKLGYCARKTGDIGVATDYLIKSDLINSASVWTLRQLAELYVIDGKSDKALECYRRARAIKPDDLNLACAMANVLLDSGKTREALNIYFEIDVKRPGGDRRSTRGIAKCSLLLGDNDRARDYLTRLELIDGLTAGDLMTLAAVEMNTGNTGAAAARIKEAHDKAPDDFDMLAAETADMLADKGADRLTIDIIIDNIKSNS